MTKKTIFILVLLIASLTMACSCSLLGLPSLSNLSLDRLRGSGTVVTEEREIQTVSEVQIDGSGTLHFTQGDEIQLIIEAEDNIINRIQTSVVGDRLIIQPESNWFDLWTPTKEIHYYLTLPSLQQLDAAGSINVEIDTLESDALTISLSGSSNLLSSRMETADFDLSGSGSADVDIQSLTAEKLTASFSGSNNFILGEAITTDVEINAGGSMNLTVDVLSAEDVKIDFSGSADCIIGELNANSLDLKMGGSAKIKVGNGTVNEQKINITGSGLYLADDLQSETAHISGGGSANASLWVTEELHISVAGSSKISYYGSPTIQQFTTGSSDIISLGEKESDDSK